MPPRGHSPRRWHAVGLKRTTAALKVLEKETQRRYTSSSTCGAAGREPTRRADGQPTPAERARPRGVSGNDAPRATRPLATTTAAASAEKKNSTQSSCRCPCECTCCKRALARLSMMCGRRHG
ncbi:hypothetical protein DIPPA_17808 [Diplonema papillatum]|nr:hypothetical protein DIPPA_17808 [Diplonema papillatum]